MEPETILESDGTEEGALGRGRGRCAMHLLHSIIRQNSSFPAPHLDHSTRHWSGTALHSSPSPLACSSLVLQTGQLKTSEGHLLTVSLLCYQHRHFQAGLCGQDFLGFHSFLLRKKEKQQRRYPWIPFPLGHHSARQGLALGATARPQRERVSLRAALLCPFPWVGKHSGHFAVLFPPLGQCTWVWVLFILFIQWSLQQEGCTCSTGPLDSEWLLSWAQACRKTGLGTQSTLQYKRVPGAQKTEL